MRYSKQREAIRQYVMQSMEHPTAQEVYQGVMHEFPQISLGTVYRNLMQLTESGEFRLVDVGDGISRFDRNAGNHQHFKCTECGRIYDVESVEPDKLEGALTDALPGVPTSYSLTLFGLCDQCLRDQESSEN